VTGDFLLREKCERAVSRFLPEDKYEVKDLMVLYHKGECLVDFVRRGFEPSVDCTDVCSSFAEEEEYDECLEECESSLAQAVRASATFKPNGYMTGLNLPGQCEVFLASVGGLEEGGEEMRHAYEKLVREVTDEGCILHEGYWIHSHELVREFIGGREFWEEYPAICYYHVSGSGEGCRIDRVLDILSKYV